MKCMVSTNNISHTGVWIRLCQVFLIHRLMHINVSPMCKSLVQKLSNIAMHGLGCSATAYVWGWKKILYFSDEVLIFQHCNEWHYTSSAMLASSQIGRLLPLKLSQLSPVVVQYFPVQVCKIFSTVVVSFISCTLVQGGIQPGWQSLSLLSLWKL